VLADLALPRILLLAVSSLATVSCEGDIAGNGEGWDSYGRAGEWPVAKIVPLLEFGEMSFYPASDTSWTVLVDLSVFEGFWPGMTGDDAVRAVGPPDQYREHGSDRYWIYRRPGARVIVADKDKGSLFAGRWWRLEALFDPPVPSADLLHPSVVQELPSRSRLTAAIMTSVTSERSPAAWVSLEDGWVTGVDLAPRATAEEFRRSQDAGGAGRSFAQRPPS